MSDIEAFLLFLVYILPFSGIGNIIYGITEKNKLKIILGTACVTISLFIMGYLICKLKKENESLAKQKRKLLIGLFRQVIGGCFLIIVEFLILSHFIVQIRYIVLIICISLVIMTILVSLRQKL